MDFLEWARGRKLPKTLQTRAGWAKLFELKRSKEPHLHQIEPTNCCPYACKMCPRDEKMTRKQGVMDTALFKKVIDEVSTYSVEVREKEIELFHFGESLMHPDIAVMTGYASSAGLRPTLSINPGELNHSLIDELLDNEPYRIIVSLDSMNGEIYRAIRGPAANIEKAVEMTGLLLKRHRETASPAIVTVRMIMMDLNRNEAKDFKTFWEGRGAEVELRDFFPWSSKQFSALGSFKKYPPFMPCPFPWQYLVVQYNGDIVPCCRDYNGELALGNVNKNTLKEIWNGEAYGEFRQRMAAGRSLSKFCRECLSIYYTEQSPS